MAATIDLYKAVSDIINEYETEALEVIEELAPRIGKETAAKLKKASPRSGAGGKHYASGWTYEAKKGRTGTTAIVYNKTKPGVAHLLEHGHMLRNGQHSAVQVHIKPVEEEMAAKFYEEAKEALTK